MNMQYKIKKVIQIQKNKPWFDLNDLDEILKKIKERYQLKSINQAYRFIK